MEYKDEICEYLEEHSRDDEEDFLLDCFAHPSKDPYENFREGFSEILFSEYTEYKDALIDEEIKGLKGDNLIEFYKKANEIFKYTDFIYLTNYLEFDTYDDFLTEEEITQLKEMEEKEGDYDFIRKKIISIKKDGNIDEHNEELKEIIEGTSFKSISELKDWIDVYEKSNKTLLDKDNEKTQLENEQQELIAEEEKLQEQQGKNLE